MQAVFAWTSAPTLLCHSQAASYRTLSKYTVWRSNPQAGLICVEQKQVVGYAVSSGCDLLGCGSTMSSVLSVVLMGARFYDRSQMRNYSHKEAFVMYHFCQQPYDHLVILSLLGFCIDRGDCVV